MGNGNWQWVNSFQLWLKNFANLSPFGTATLAQRGRGKGGLRAAKGVQECDDQHDGKVLGQGLREFWLCTSTCLGVSSSTHSRI